MNNLFKYIYIFVIVFLFSLNIGYSQPMNGIYTIDNSLSASSTNFTSFSSAVFSLTVNGIDDDVVINVASGIEYNEQVLIPNISVFPPLSDYTVTFQSTGVSATLSFSPPAGFNYVLKFAGTRNVIFSKIIIKNTNAPGGNNGIVVDISGDCQNITIKECELIGIDVGVGVNSLDYSVVRHKALGTPSTVGEISLINNIITNGTYGVYFEGKDNSNRCVSNVIEGNLIDNYYYTGIFSNFQNTISISKNSLLGKGTGQEKGIYCSNTGENSVIERNEVYIYGNASINSGIHITNCHPTSFKVSNNMIYGHGTVSTYGINCDNSSLIEILHNTVNIDTGSGASLNLGNSCSDLIVKYNIFTNSVDYAIKIADANAFTNSFDCDYNNLYVATGDIGWLASEHFTTLTSWQDANGYDINSFSLSVPYISADNLHIESCSDIPLDGGANGSNVSEDYDGDFRTSPPLPPGVESDIGADQFVGAVNVIAGSDKNACSSSSSLSVFDSPPNGYWSCADIGSSVIINNTVMKNSVVDNLKLENNTFVWTVEVDGCVGTDDMVIYNGTIPTPTIYNDVSIVCDQTIQLQANDPPIGIGKWEFISGSGIIDDPTNNFTTAILEEGNNNIKWSIKTGCGTDSDSKNIEYYFTHAGFDSGTCFDESSLGATDPNLYSGEWTVENGGSAIIENNTLYDSNVNSLDLGSNTFLWSVDVGTCIATDEVVITNNYVEANVGSDFITIMPEEVILNAVEPVQGNGYWTKVNGFGATIDNPTLYNSPLSGVNIGDYSFQWEVSLGFACSDFAEVVVSYHPAALSGTYTIDNTSLTDYVTKNINDFEEAVYAINTYGYSSDVTFIVKDDQNFYCNPMTFTDIGSIDKKITFKRSGDGVSKPEIYIYGGVGYYDAGFLLEGCNYIEFDDLAIFDYGVGAADEIEYGFLLTTSPVSSTGSNYIKIKNCDISFASNNSEVEEAGIAVVATISDPNVSNSNNEFYNNVISNCDYGYYLKGDETYNDKQNIIGNTTGCVGEIYNINIGIYISGQDNIDIYGQEIYDMVFSSGKNEYIGIYVFPSNGKINIYSNEIYNFDISSSYSQLFGIYTRSNSTTNIYKNNIYGLSSEGGNCYVVGIMSSSLGDVHIYNNMVSDIQATGEAMGIGLESGGVISNAYLYYNSVYLDYISSSGNIAAALRVIDDNIQVDIRNNIFVSDVSNAESIAFLHDGNGLFNVKATSNNNIYYGGQGAKSHIFYNSTHDYQDKTIDSYQERVQNFLGNLTVEASSISELPPFIDNTDLHLSTALPSKAESGGTLITGYSLDFDGDSRNATTPDIGADEDDFSAYVDQPGYSLKFDANTDKVEIATLTSDLLDLEGRMTVSTWIKLDGTPTDNATIAGTQGAWWLLADSQRRLIFTYKNGAATWSTPLASLSSLEIGKWYHVAATFNTDNISIYINGILESSIVSEGRIKSVAGNVSYIGNSEFKGEIDELRIWTASLSKQNIKDMMHKTIDLNFVDNNVGGLNWEKLLAYYRFDHSSGTLLRDMSGNDYNGIATNTNWMTSKAMIPFTALAAYIYNEGFDANWYSVENATNYYLDVSTSNNFSNSIITDEIIDSDQNWFTLINPISKGQTYYYRLSADVDGIRSNESAVSSFMVQPGNAGIFNGSSNYLDIGELSISAGGFTIETWIKYSGFKNNSPIIEMSDGSDNIFLSNVGTTNNLRFGVNNGGTLQYVDARNILELNKWIHIAASMDNTGNVTIYKNSYPVSTGTIIVPNAGLRTNCYIAKSNNPSNGYFAGQMDEFKIWNTVLEEDQIEQTMYHPVNENELPDNNWGDLELYYRFDQAAGTVLDDFSYFGNNATVSGMTFTTSAAMVAFVKQPTYISSDGFTANWDYVENSEKYFIDVSTYANFSNIDIIENKDVGLNTWFDVSYNIQKGKTYYYRVRYQKDGFTSANSDVMSFMLSPGNALAFNGSTNSAIVPASSTLNHTSAITVETWIKPNTLVEKEAAVSYLQDNGSEESGYGLVFMNDKMRFFLVTTTMTADEVNSNPGARLQTGQWQHIAGTYDGSQIKFYLNGELIETKAASGNIDWSFTPDDLRIGQYKDSDENYYFDGSMDELRIWKKALTSAQLKDMMHVSVSQTYVATGLTWSDLSAYYPFDNNSTSAITDYAAYSNSGTILGASRQLSGAMIPFVYPASNIVNTSFTANWKAVVGATKYYLDVSTRSNFSVIDVISDADAGAATSYNVLHDLEEGVTYYYRVKADINGSISDYSEATSFMLPPGNAFDFDGVNDYVNLSTDGFSPNTGTVSLWFKTDNANVTQNLFTLTPDKQAGEVMLYMLGGELKGKVGGLIISSAVKPLINNWNHVALTWSNGNAAIYVNGDFVKSGSYVSFFSLDTYATLGSFRNKTSGTINNYFNGMMDEVRVWSKALTQTQIKTQMESMIDENNMANGLLISDLEAYYRFDYKAGNTLYDFSQNRNHATLINTAASGWKTSYAMIHPNIGEADEIQATSFTANWIPADIGGIPTAYFLDVSETVSFSSILADYNNLNTGNVDYYTIKGLQPAKEYFYRIRSYKDVVSGQSQHSNVALVTTNQPPVITTMLPTDVEATGGQLNGQINPNNSIVTDILFEYGLETGIYSYEIGTSTTYADGWNNVEVNTFVPLSAGLKYYYRLKAMVDDQIYYGDEMEVEAPSPVVLLDGHDMDFDDVEVYDYSAEYTYTLSAYDLYGVLSITAPEAFEISRTSGVDFVPENPINIEPVDGIIDLIPIYVRFAPIEVGTFIGSIDHTTVGTLAFRLVYGAATYKTPDVQTSEIEFINTETRSVTVNWTNGAGTHQTIFVKKEPGNSDDLFPVPDNNETYIADNDWNESNDEITYSNYYCVYNSSSSMSSTGSVQLTNLFPGTNYSLIAFEYNGVPGEEMYNSTANIENMAEFNTLMPSLSITHDHLSEINLDGASINIKIINENFIDANLLKSKFYLENAPDGLQIDLVSYIDANNAELKLKYDGTDFDANITNFKIVVDVAEVTGVIDIVSNISSIAAIDEPTVIKMIAGEIMEEAENGSEILVTVDQDLFVENLTKLNWTITGLPQGVSIGEVIRENDNSATIVLKNNREIDFDADITDITLIVSGAEFEIHKTEAIATSGVKITAIVEPAFIETVLNLPIKEGSEDGREITVLLYEDTFVETINQGNWIVSGLPVGVDASVERLSSTSALIILHGNRIIDFDTSVELEITVKTDELILFEDDVMAYGIEIVADSDTEEIAIKDDGLIIEGKEDGEIISVILSGGTYSENLNLGHWTVENLPIGVITKTMYRVSSTQVDIILSGNRTKDYDTDIKNFRVSIVANGVDDMADGLLSVETGCTFTAIKEEFTATESYSLNEMNLYDAVINLSLNNEYFNDFSASVDNFVLNNQPQGVTVDAVSIISSHSAILSLAYDGTNFESSIGFRVSVLPEELNGVGEVLSNYMFVSSWTGPRPLDSLALVALYKSTNGELWTNNSNWLETPVTEWYGISIRESQVVAINLNSNNLSGQLPSEIGDLTGLERLYLSNNSISGAIPLELGSAISLQKLMISNNQLSGILPKELGALPDLTVINLSQNQLSGDIPESYGQLPNIETIRLQENMISGKVPDELGQLTTLEYLYLQNNQLTELTDFKGIITLQEIDVSNNQLTFDDLLTNADLGANYIYAPQADVNDEMFIETDYGNPATFSVTIDITQNQYQWLKDGEFLDLPSIKSTYNIASITFDDAGTYGCDITNDKLPELTLHRRSIIFYILGQDEFALKALYLSTDGSNWTPINWPIDDDISLWEGVTIVDGRVTAVDLNGNNLNGTLPSEINKLTKLTDFNLSNNTISGNIPDEIGSMTELRNLNFNDNNISGNIPAEFSRLQYLTNLSLAGNIIEGVIPSSLGEIATLMNINLQDNKLNGAIPDDLSNLINLNELNLSINEFSGSIPEELANLSNLLILKLNNNKFIDDIPVEFINLTNIQQFDINNNNIDELHDLSSMTSLNEFNVSNNYLTFEDLEPNVNIPGLIYSPQAKVNDSLKVSVILKTEIELDTDVEGTENFYQWFKDDVAITNISDVSKFYLESATVDDGGIYYCDITNSIASDLVLRRHHIEVRIAGQDSLALDTLYKIAGGTNWTNQKGWDLKSNLSIDEWYGVTVVNGRVTQLDLNDNNLIGELPNDINYLTKIKKLDLSANKLSGSIEYLCDLDQLTNLNIDNNNFEGEIPVAVEKLNMLTRLFLNDNNFSGTIPVELTVLINLTKLDLSNNQLSGSVIDEIDNLSKLTSLNISNNLLEGTLTDAIGNLENLASLNISNNKFTNIPDYTTLENIIEFNVADNQLTFADIEQNIELTSNFTYWPQAEIGTTIIEEINEGQNYALSVTVDGTANNYQWFRNNIVIEGATEVIYKIIDATYENDGEYICHVSNTIANKLTLIRKPIFITTKLLPIEESDSLALVILYNSTNGDSWTNSWDLSKPLSEWEVVKSKKGKVTKLVLSDNNMSGQLPLELTDLTMLEYIDFSSNNIVGQINVDFGQFTNLKYLDLGNNDFIGQIPESLENINDIIHLDLSGNQLEGEVPENINSLYSLTYLNLSNNDLSGSLVAKFDKLINLGTLLLGNNNFSGNFSDDILTLSKLIELNIASNDLSGEFPQNIGDLSTLEILNLGENNLSGSIPKSLGAIESLVSLFLNGNNLSGEIPSELGATTASRSIRPLREMHLNDNQLSGSIPLTFENLNIESLNLSNNMLTGSIPENLGDENLYILDLSSNQLTGTINLDFASFDNLFILKLKENNLEDLADISNISFDNLVLFSVMNNYMTFEDLEINIKNPKSGFKSIFEYYPQKNREVETVYIRKGEELILSVNIGGENNDYKWEKGETTLNSTSNTLSVSNIQLINNGEYDCIVTNSDVPGLEIISRFEVTVEVDVTMPEVIPPKEYCIGTNVTTLQIEEQITDAETYWYSDEELQNEIGKGESIRVTIEGDRQTFYVINRESIFKSSVVEVPVILRPTVILSDDKASLIATFKEHVTYEWYYNNNLVTEIIGYKMPLLGNGTYQVTLVDGICASTSRDVIFNDGNLLQVGISAQSDLEDLVEIYPNPGQGVFNIKIKGMQNISMQIKITDLSGKLIYIDKFTKQTEIHKQSINITEFDPGVYILQLQSDKGNVVKQIIKY